MRPRTAADRFSIPPAPRPLAPDAVAAVSSQRRVGPVEAAISALNESALAQPVRGQWIVDPTFQPSSAERTFSTPFLIVHVERQGCAYFSRDALDDARAEPLVGRTVLECLGMAQYARVAVTDAAYAGLEGVPKPAETVVVDGTVTEKARIRAELATRETLRSSPQGGRAALVGYSGEIAACLRANGFEVLAYDLDPEVISPEVESIKGPVNDGSDFFETEADVVVATGMTLVTETFAAVSDHCARTGADLVMYCQTAANLGPMLLAHGATAVVAEHVPFYNWEGQSRVSLYRDS